VLSKKGGGHKFKERGSKGEGVRGGFVCGEEGRRPKKKGSTSFLRATNREDVRFRRRTW